LTDGTNDYDWSDERHWMVEAHLKKRGIDDPRLLAAFDAVPRHRFLRPADIEQSYEDHAVSIGLGQTISQPYIVALMTQALRLIGPERVLEVGTGSGYQTAILAELSAEVHTIERIPRLSEQARARLDQLGVTNVHYHVGDGTLGVPEEAPFDGIIVTASAPAIPPSLKSQLGDRGRLVMPVGGRGGQSLILLERKGDGFKRTDLTGCVFVRLIGAEGWPPE
jgi:protein-L-isoaspartate(D-aspartate) O-methyltransferase